MVLAVLAVLPIAIAGVAGETVPTHGVARVIRGVGRGPFHHAELRLDQLEPRRIRRREHRRDTELTQQLEEARVVVDVGEVIEDHVEPAPGIAGAQLGHADALKAGEPPSPLHARHPGHRVNLPHADPLGVAAPVVARLGRARVPPVPERRPCHADVDGW